MTERTYQTIELKIRNRVARVSLDRPDVRNAFNEVMIEDLIRAIDRVEADDSVRVLVLTGKGVDEGNSD